jgi:hypothetical protein
VEIDPRLNLPLHEVGHLVGYRKAGAAVVHIRPWQGDGFICTGFPASCETGTQLPLICGMVATLLFDTRLAKVRGKIVPMVLQSPYLLPHLIAPLQAYDEDIADLDVTHARYDVEVHQTFELLQAADLTELLHLAQTLLDKGSLCMVTEGARPLAVTMALHEMDLLPAKGAA